jgi:hypothetical protein
MPPLSHGAQHLDAKRLAQIRREKTVDAKSVLGYDGLSLISFKRSPDSFLEM